jgi:hypothetical protein
MGDLTDKSTDIEKSVKAFAKKMTTESAKILKGVKNAKDKQKVVTFSLSGSSVSKSRTPKEQAKLLSDGSTKVCWSAHMSDKARHVLMKVDGKVSWDAKDAFGDKFSEFKTAWNKAMKSNSLKNAAGKDGWPSWDQFHLELDDAKIKRSSERAQACVEEYVRLTRKDKKKKNTGFEKNYKKMIDKALKALKITEEAK